MRVLAATVVGISTLTFFGFATVGCKEPSVSTTRTTTYGGIGWGDNQSEDVTPGVDHAVLAWYLQDDRLEYVVWTDLQGDGSSAGSGGSSGPEVETHQTTISSHSGGELRFEWTRLKTASEGSNPGSITIDDVEYDLKEGALLLVSTAGGNIKVEQLKMPTEIRELLRDNPESPRDELRAMANDEAFEIGATFENATK